MTDLPALREAVAKMTEGPWTVETNGDMDVRSASGEILATDLTYYPWTFNATDTAGIVALRNAAPALLDEVEALRQHHAEAVEAAYREGFYEGMTSSYQADRKYAYSDVNGWWLASKAKRELEGNHD